MNMAKKYYFIGIGGISMSALAIFLKLSGEQVSGSDINLNETMQNLDKFNITYNIGHFAKNIEEYSPDIVVINCAIDDKNEELNWAKNNKIKIVSRAKLLGDFSKNFKNVIAISGTHGKTTTVGMISEIFIEAGLKPSVHIGGILNKINSNFLVGEQKFFITEACEYKNSFLYLRPKIGVMLNIERDHMDFFKNYKELENSFDKFLTYSKIKIYPKSVHSDFDFYYQSNTKLINFYAKNIEKSKRGIIFKYYENGKFITTIRLNTFGTHNVNNAIVAIMIARHYKVKIADIKRALKNFSGVKRRFETIGYIGNAVVIHDYAHHPTEIKKVISQAKELGKVLTIFQPHTYSRTKKLFNSFKTAFDESDKTILYKTYPARETADMGYDAKKLYESLSDKLEIEYFDDENKMLKAIKKQSKHFEVLLFLGAGNIDLSAKKLLK